jgi:GT2 family glycosyltransferase
MQTPPLVYIVVLTHNQRALTLECLASLAKLDYANAAVVVVDNDPRDDTAVAVRQEFPHANYIANDANLGYAEGNNVGVRFAVEHHAEYVLVLNNDTTVAPDLLTRLVEVAEQNSNAAFLGPLVYHFDEPRVIQSAGGWRTRNWRFYHRGQNETDNGQFTDNERVVWISGCAIMARAAALKKIGLIDPAFFIYSEEVDWCLRAAQAGYENILVPAARLWHKGVQRNYAPSPRVTYLSARNELLLLKKHHAGAHAMMTTWLRHIRTLISWSVRPRWKSQRVHRDALARGLRDFAQGHFGAPPPF